MRPSRTRPTSLALLAIAAPVLAACARSRPAPPPPAATTPAAALGAALSAERAAWRARRLDAYTFHYRQDCFCAGGGRWYRVAVRDGKVVEAVPRDAAAGGKGPPLAADAVPTVDLLFARAVRALAEGADSVAVEYDARGHYPSRLYVDWDRSATDDEIVYAVDSLTPR
ncbi:MAG: DUF6174 domain-containing protein [Gemmatimonadaceae bacterium]